MSIVQLIHFLLISNEVTAPWRKQWRQKWFNSILALRSTGKDNSCRHFLPTRTISTQSAPFLLAHIPGHIPGSLLLLTSVDKMLGRYFNAQSNLTWNFVPPKSYRMPLEMWGALHCPPVQVVWLSGSCSTPCSLSPNPAQILPGSGGTPLLLHMIQYFCIQRSKNCTDFYCSKGPQKERSKLWNLKSIMSGIGQQHQTYYCKSVCMHIHAPLQVIPMSVNLAPHF